MAQYTRRYRHLLDRETPTDYGGEDGDALVVIHETGGPEDKYRMMLWDIQGNTASFPVSRDELIEIAKKIQEILDEEQ